MPGNGAARRAAALRPLAQMIIEIERPHPVRVGVDRFSAAGKSTMADELAAMVTGQGRPCLRAGLDDFKRPRAQRPPGPEGFYRGGYDLDASARSCWRPWDRAGIGRSACGSSISSARRPSRPRCSRCPPTRS